MHYSVKRSPIYRFARDGSKRRSAEIDESQIQFFLRAKMWKRDISEHTYLFAPQHIMRTHYYRMVIYEDVKESRYRLPERVSINDVFLRETRTCFRFTRGNSLSRHALYLYIPRPTCNHLDLAFVLCNMAKDGSGLRGIRSLARNSIFRESTWS